MATHRTPEARIAVLEAQIERIKTRAERAKVRKDPTLRHMRAAVRQIDKAAGACGDRVVRGELQEARTRIAACLALGMGLEAVPPRGPRSAGSAATQDSSATEALLDFVANHPGQTEKAVAAALKTDLDGLHALTRPLIAAGRMRVRVAPVTRYWVGAR